VLGSLRSPLRRAAPVDGTGELEPIIGTVLPLSEAATAHRAFEERSTIGKTILTP
jgi:NADPH2:quinone reductase